ncbi:MAG: elongation factor P [Chloroflexi bacterium]|nr:elongation factor P [Chloroflexota bacterium]MCL5074818.1 elongation factor P [Chloroflexota bacterium]
MIDAGELRKGITIELEGQLFNIADYQHIKMGRGGALVRLKLRNLRSGYTAERTFPASERFKRVFLDRHRVQFIYHDDANYYFMDVDTFEQTGLPRGQLGDDVGFLKEGLVVDLLTYNEAPISIELPVTVDLQVVETEPGVRGDTASGGSKPATLETGRRIQVPLFVNIGDVVRVDTRSGAYLERVS